MDNLTLLMLLNTIRSITTEERRMSVEETISRILQNDNQIENLKNLLDKEEKEFWIKQGVKKW